MFRRLGTRLNGVIQAAAVRTGLQFVDIAAAFRGHEVCGLRNQDWVNGPSVTYKKSKSFTDDESFHPTLQGQHDGYAAAINKALAP